MASYKRRQGSSASVPDGPTTVDPTDQDVVVGRSQSTPMQRPASGWFWSATVAVSLLVLVVAVAGVKSWADLRFSQVRADELRQKVDQVDDSVGRLQQRIHLLQSNSELLERVTREELGVVHPDEVVVILPPRTP